MLLFALNLLGLLQVSLSTGDRTSTSSEDEFEEVATEMAPSTSNPPVDIGTNEYYQSLSIFEKLRFQLLRSGDISGKGDFLIEFSIIIFILVWFVYFFTGRGYNSIIAVRWVRAYRELFGTQFAVLSSGHTDEPDTDKLLFKESDYSYSFYASGRKGAKGMSVEILLVRRQDLIMRAVDALAFPYHDKVTIQVALTDEGHPLSLFAICRKGKQSSVRNERKEFKEFATPVTIAGFPKDLVVLAETVEGVTHMLEVEGIETLKELSAYVELISLTDLNSLPVQGFEKTPQRLLTFVYRFGPSQNAETMRPLIELLLRMIDSAGSFRLSPFPKKHVERNRKILTDRIAKKLKDAQIEEASRKKMEKAELEKQREKEEYDRLSTSAKEKRDLKNEKKKKKEENAKLFKLVKK